MKTIKIIDLFNMIANGEELPKEIMFDTDRYYLNNNNHYVREYGDLIQRLDIKYNLVDCLNDEVEIIEYKKIDYCKSYECFDGVDDYIEHLKKQIDELIDVVNSIQKGE